MSLFLVAILFSSLLHTGLSQTSNSGSVDVRWLGDAPAYNLGTTFGLPWPRGKYQAANTRFTVSGGADEVNLQSWVTAYWPDDSIKWTGHAVPESGTVYDKYTVKALSGSSNSVQSTNLTVLNSASEITVNTGKLTASFPKSGSTIISSIKTSSGNTVGENGKLLLNTQSALAEDFASRTSTSIEHLNFESEIEEVTISNSSSVRALVTVRGKHQVTGSGSHASWLPFTLRFYFYENSESIKLIHTIIYDGEPAKDFINGLGISFDVPLQGEELYDRHVRLAGANGGLLSEAVKGITGLRRDPGANVRTAQYEGHKTPNSSTWDTRVTSRLRWVPNWNDYSLTQLSPDGFTVKKRTKAGQSWVKIPGGTRSGGLAYLGGATKGGLAVGLRDFWKRYPTSLDINNAATDTGKITLWLYSPSAEPLDIRPYHDGLGQKTYAEELDALEITYEDWEEGFNTPYGVGRTNEIYIFAFDQTPSREKLSSLITHVNNPPVLLASPEHILSSGAIGKYWSLPDTTTVASRTIENHLDFLFTFYKNQVEQRRWYGFWDHGDIQHSYDVDRHCWRSDVGGYAWDNSELSPDLFFWTYFLRTGREDVFRFAEAQVRHSSEVDMYHIGKWKGLGTRHGIQHWGDSAKQGRISTTQYRKYFFYLSGGDERIGEIIYETLDTDRTFLVLDPARKIRTDNYKPGDTDVVSISLGTDWSALASSWLIEWERRGPRSEEARRKLNGTLAGIANLKNGYVSGSALFNITSGVLLRPVSDPENKGVISLSHLSAVFGLAEVVHEILDHYGPQASSTNSTHSNSTTSSSTILPKGYYETWLDYAYYYGATAGEQIARYGQDFGRLSLRQGHSRLTAFVANERNNATIAARAWSEFLSTQYNDGLLPNLPWSTVWINGSAVLNPPVEEAAWLGTNSAALYGLAAIENLALVRAALG